MEQQAEEEERLWKVEEDERHRKEEDEARKKMRAAVTDGDTPVERAYCCFEMLG